MNIVNKSHEITIQVRQLKHVKFYSIFNELNTYSLETNAVVLPK